MAAIIGNTNPKVGQTNFYEISSLGFPFFNMGSTTYEWYLFKKQKNGSWIDITKNATPKSGNRVSYTFFEPVAGQLFEIRVFQTKKPPSSATSSAKTLLGRLEVRPTATKTAQIDKVVLFNRGKKDVNKADYRDTLIAQAFCTGLFGQEIEFQLWEDDAPGQGHNADINKNNKIPRVYKATVNEKGIAEARISLSTDEKIMRQVADAYVMKGDKDEGANHEYYVTATHLGKGMKASQVNVNVANPDHKLTPTEGSARFPATPASRTARQTDTKGKIIDAYFVNESGTKISKISFNDSVKVRIASQNMKGKKVQFVIWEYDLTGNDEILRKNIVINHDLGDSAPIKIDAATFGKGYATDATILGTPIDSDSVKQNYFIEIIPLDISAESTRFGVSSGGLMEVEKVKSAALVNRQTKETKETCICKEQYKDLIWGGKVSCEFRKKVVAISNRNGVDANNLMAAMAHETGGTFDPTCGTFRKHKDEAREGYVGLLQIGKDAATDLKVTRTELLNMSQIEQLDYVEKYINLPLVKGKLNTLTDFYLAVLFPVDCGKGNQPNHVVFDNSLPLSYRDGKVIKNLNYWRNAGYAANPAFHKESKESGKTYVWEISENIKKWYDNGKTHLVKEFSCQTAQETPPPKPNSKIVYFDSGLTQDRINVVSQFTISILEKAAQNSVNTQLIITSTIRSTRKQAEVMYNNESNGNHIRYAAPGREVIAVFNNGKKAGHSKEKIISDMDNKIKELSALGRRVSLHCVSEEVYKKNNIIDISYTRGIKNPRDLIRELVKDPAVTKVIHPLNNVIANDKIKFDSKEPAIHVEIKVP